MTKVFENHGDEHGDLLDQTVKVVIRRDDFVKSRPWHADIYFSDGKKWIGWQSFFRSKKSLIENARAALDTAGMHNAEIVDA